MSSEISDIRRVLPAVDRLLGEPGFRQLIALYGRDLVRQRLRQQLDAARAALEKDPEMTAGGLEELVGGLAEGVAAGLAERTGEPLRRILNATGILLHTNLGRAPLPRPIAESLPPLLDAYCNLEFDLESGRRGERNEHAARMLTLLTGAEAALVVNNNAAALVLILATLAASREVIVSRGELVEIGGSFRIPEIMGAAGVKLVEVGATNRTRIDDYEQAIGPETALLLKVNPSNYKMSGFVASVEAPALVELGRRRGLPVAVDEGSGLVRPHRASALVEHPSLQELVEAGCDLACGSGDKLLGGPQAGLIVGRREIVERCRRHPLYRALRPDRAAFAALDGVLRAHLSGATLPLDRLWPEAHEHRQRLVSVAEAIGARIVPAEAFLGGGAAPEKPIQGEAIALPGDDGLLRRLRQGDPPIVGYLREGLLMLDLRTVDPEDDFILVDAVKKAQGG
jgi:L-seryl-tRNA(Ser) seleniumtransferase